jgi:hypothetical protein
MTGAERKRAKWLEARISLATIKWRKLDREVVRLERKVYSLDSRADYIRHRCIKMSDELRALRAKS